jgi:hypothetical protein
MMPSLADAFDAAVMGFVKRWVPALLVAGVLLAWAGAAVVLAWGASL